MKLMHDTASLVNYMLENDSTTVKVGDTFAKLMWTDRTLYKVVGVNGKSIIAKRVQTYMKDWSDGTQYPKTDSSGNWLLSETEHILTKPRKYWKLDGQTAFLNWGAKTGYRDPSF